MKWGPGNGEGRPPGYRPDRRPQADSSPATAGTAPTAESKPELILRMGADLRPGPDPERELEAWKDAVLHLRTHGLEAGGVPELVAARLRRQGITVGWTAAA